GPGDAPMTIDIDSTINGVHGKAKQGASYGYTKKLGYHPLLATRAETGEVLHVRFRGGRTNTGRGAPRFIDELVGRVRRAGATGELTLRADSGFWSKKVIKACRKHGVRYSITVRNTKPIKKAIGAIADDVWVRIPYPESGIAEVAEVAHDGARLIVRRVRNLNDQGELFPDWRYHAFITDRVGPTLELEADHRNHAVIELAIRDLKEGAGWNHFPSGRFNANAACLVLAALAHNLLRWTGRLALPAPGPVVAKTLRFRYLSLPGRVTRSARRETLHLPQNWPWRTQFSDGLGRLRAVPAAACPHRHRPNAPVTAKPCPGTARDLPRQPRHGDHGRERLNRNAPQDHLTAPPPSRPSASPHTSLGGGFRLNTTVWRGFAPGNRCMHHWPDDAAPCYACHHTASDPGPRNDAGLGDLSVRRSSRRSCSPELRGTALPEGAEAFVGVGGGEGADNGDRFVFELGVQGLAHTVEDQTSAPAEGEGGARGQAVSQLAGAGFDLVIGDDPVHEPPGFRLGGGEDPVGVHQFERAVEPDDPGEQPGGSTVHGDPDPGPAQTEARRLGGEDDVAGRQEGQPAADDRAMPDSDHGHLQPGEAGDRLVEFRDEIPDEWRALIDGVVAKHVDVGAEAEVLSVPPQDDGAHIGLRGQPRGGLGQFDQELGGEGVAGVGTVEHELGDGRADVANDGLEGHAASLPLFLGARLAGQESRRSHDATLR